MENFYFPLFRGVVRVSVFAPAAFLLICMSEGAASFACIFASAALHEAGHWSFIRLVGERVTLFRVEPFGGIMSYTTSRCTYGDEMLIASGGVVFNLLGAFVSSAIFALWKNVYLLLFIFSCFFFALVNALPLRGSDGYRFVYLAICRKGDEEKAKRITDLFSVVSLFALASAALYILYISDFNNGLCVIFLLAAMK